MINRIHWHHQKARLKRDLAALLQDLKLWLKFSASYIKSKLEFFAEHFESFKGIIVTFLLHKRGRYSRSFLNVSVFVIVGAGFIVAPIIKESHPIVGGTGFEDYESPSAVLSSLTYDEISTSTQISEKPRDQVIEYVVREGDTVSSIAEQFGVSEDTIKWANDLTVKNPVLKIETMLKVPPVSGVVHTVKKGETVYSISKKYQAEAQNIVNFPFNEFADLETFALDTGQILIVPDGVIQGAKPVIRQVPLAPEIIAHGDGQFLWPTNGRITQNFVWYHKAIDIANKQAPSIAAADTGTVVYAGCLKWGYGCHVIVDHGNGFQTLYAHLSQYYVNVGDAVARGQSIGQMGSTGRSTGTHLHFEIRKNGVALNPMSFLQ
ncbi:hypothetical protein COW99_03645 [Candidatus Roizmanbacteria bacterium CG22_combo_CG10-13_8_21_14_all_38_20]|uniref:LysM domain-containing protein n=1 Tax=Candidatus Roizmanbacteria bacterium CG22_combo_CG10-13_8_21_14_all_38_20 TaxID=1974862 RepID=A0A2H0BV23_9BACT|nr:peptidoglycan DD-metalloendopeptidase family protein [Candidatus Microgenomates bacterium]PIP61536.1 MAG: hypothetical protein COW99_03645 [Candidatus Roizmanbacteria bacterium CG22_combo_CG10-13_8_21_14_all_38_20]PJC31724.1 MAG: hypothetical protein CO050_02210 [Candidatus Roizmanbacteria bacterium CG_4_9_14_0_2_um_filter_38_17]